MLLLHWRHSQSSAPTKKKRAPLQEVLSCQIKDLRLLSQRKRERQREGGSEAGTGWHICVSLSLSLFCRSVLLCALIFCACEVMTRNFHRWEVDPFFSAAEEVQDSADRLESVYRTWIHAKSTVEAEDDWNSVNIYRRELATALGTTKWQLEEFERAVAPLAIDGEQYGGDDTPSRHKQFIEAIRSQITCIEQVLLSSEDSSEAKALPIVNLAQEEKDDLAMFLSGSREHPRSEVGSLSKGSFASVDRDVPCTSPESVESKIDITTLSSNSKKALNHPIKSDASYQPMYFENVDGQRMGHFQRPGRTANSFLEITVDQTERAASDPAPEHSHTDDSDGIGISAERVNGRHRSSSVGSGLNSWRSGTVTRSIKRQLHNHAEDESNLSGFWSFLKKKQHTIELRLSKSGFKRWKDGDADIRDQSEVSRLMEGVNDVEKVNAGIRLGGNRVGAFQTLQCSHQALSSSRPVQIASAILVTLGFVGLLSFHVTSSAI